MAVVTKMVALQPRRVALQPGSVALQPRRVALQPGSVALQPRRVALQPGSVALQPRRVALQPRAVALQPIVVYKRDVLLNFRLLRDSVSCVLAVEGRTWGAW